MPIFAVHLSQYSPLDLLLIINNIDQYISTILETLLATSFSIMFIAIFFTIFHDHLKNIRIMFLLIGPLYILHVQYEYLYITLRSHIL